MTQHRSSVASPFSKLTGADLAQIVIVAGCDGPEDIPNFLRTVLTSITAGHHFRYYIEGDEGDDIVVWLAFTIHLEHSVFYIRNRADLPAGTFASFEAAIAAGMALAKR